MANKLITCSFITIALSLSAALASADSPTLDKTSPQTQQDSPSSPLASQLAGTPIPATANTTETESKAATTEKMQRYEITAFYSEQLQHQLTQAQLKKFNNLYLSSLPEKVDVISPTIKRTLDTHYDLFSANYRVQSPLVWTGDILAGWGMLPHSGGSSRAEFFIHRNGQALVVITLENKQFHFGAKALLNNAYVKQELATSAQTH